MALLGDGQYNLLSMKEIFVTDYFMELDENIRLDLQSAGSSPNLTYTKKVPLML